MDVAVRLTGEQGLDRVTMRSVAAELDVTPMALYYYVKDKDELVALIAAEVSSHGLPLELGEDGWEESLRRYMMSRWSDLRPYRGLGAHMISLPTLGTTPEGHANGVKFFEDAGFPPRLARLAWPYASRSSGCPSLIFGSVIKGSSGGLR